MKDDRRFGIWDRCLLLFAAAGLTGIAFVGGTAVQYFGWPPSASMFFTRSYESAQAWAESFFAEDPVIVLTNVSERNPLLLNERIISTPRVSEWDKERAYNGYTLLTTGFFDAAFLVDMEGKIVHRWDMPFYIAWPEPTHVHTMTRAVTFMDYAYVYPNGDLLALYSALGDTPYGYGIAKLDKDSNLLWTYSANTHHQLYVDSHGDIYTLAHKIYKDPLPDTESLVYPMLIDYIVKLSPEGKEQDWVLLMNAFLDTPYEYMLYHERNGGLATWDHFHTNSIQVLEPDMAKAFPMFKAGQVLVSIRSMNAIAVIDMQTKKVVWAYNGTWKMQHDARFLKNGHILVFDNGAHFEDGKPYSRVVEFDPKTNGVVWMYAGNEDRDFRSIIVGKAQRLPNGNTLIDESMRARLLEVTEDGDIVWRYELQRIRRRDDTLNAILSATRYAQESLPFLTPSNKTTVNKPSGGKK